MDIVNLLPIFVLEKSKADYFHLIIIPLIT